ncbi:hypothetical protein SDJN03_15309, partial [Cucurbita argyrosperma subsp. sororia]
MEEGGIKPNSLSISSHNKSISATWNSSSLLHHKTMNWKWYHENDISTKHQYCCFCQSLEDRAALEKDIPCFPRYVFHPCCIHTAIDFIA